MTINFYLNPNKKGSTELTIFCYVRGHGKTIIINTGQRLDKKYWDSKKQKAFDRGKGRYTGAPELNSFLLHFSERVNNILREYEKSNPETSFEQIKSNLLEKLNIGKYKKQQTFFDIFDEYIRIQTTSVSPGTIKKYKVIKNHLLSFQTKKKYKITFESMTMSFRDSFMFYLLNDKEMLDSSAHKVIKFVKAFLSWSGDRKYHKNFEFKIWKGKEYKSEIITLTEEELKALKCLDIQDEKLDRVRDLFLFQCYTGVRYSDLKKINWDNIKGDVWHVRTQKTDDILEIPLSADALLILDKYKGKLKPLPIISNQKCNDYLKDLCNKAEINEKVTISKSRNNKKEENILEKWELIGSHTARRTFITLSLERGMRPEVIMKITGHTSYRTMQKYINVTNKIVKNEFQKAWGTPLRLISTKEA